MHLVLKKAVRRSIQFASIASLFIVHSLALDPSKTLTQYAHRIWGQEEGLFQPTVYSILQTRDGFLWLGTQDSLIRFDGMHFREFSELGESGFDHSLIRSLFEDQSGNLWVGSAGDGLARISPSGVVKRFTAKDGFPGNSALSIATDAEGAVWIATNAGLAQWTQGRFRTFTTADGLPSNHIRGTCVSTSGTRWVAGLDFGLSFWNGSRFQTFEDKNISPTEGISAIVCSPEGAVWIGESSGLVEIRDHASRVLTTANGLPDNAVSSLLVGPHGSLWIGTNDGISRYQNGEINVYRTRDGLSHSLVLSLYMDREGSLWAGTKDGLDQFADAKVTPYTTNDGMASNAVGPVLEDAAGRLWVGTLGHGLENFDGRRFHTLTKTDGLLDDTILSLQLDKTGDLWVGSTAGLNRLHDGKVIRAYTRNEGLSGSEVRALLTDEQGTLWVGTNEGLNRFDGTRFTQQGAWADSDGIVALAGGHTVRVFESTDSANLFLLRNGSVSKSPVDVLRPVDCYFLDHVHHSAWMGTLGSGLVRWQNGAVAHVRVRDGLYDNRIYSIVRDDQANFWLASSKGIFRVSEKELDDFADGKVQSVTSVPFSTGQLRFECQSGVQPAAYRTRDGRLWFSTTNGLVVLDPNHFVRNNVPPPTQITAMFVDGERVPDIRHLDLPPARKNLDIRYAGLSFISPEKVSFRYILEGYEKKWTDAGTRREAFFTNLPPGKFQFKVISRNADGVWSTDATILAFTIEPRLYQRVWFFPLLAVLIAICIVAGYRIRIRQLNDRFALILAERSRIARELHDTLLQGLTGITMQLQALWTKLPASKEKLALGEIIQDAGRCSKEARESLWGLRATHASCVGFADKLSEMAKRATTEKAISLRLRFEALPHPLSAEIQHQLLRVAHEVISNSLAHAAATVLEISLSVSNDHLSLTFDDNGIGFVDHQPIGHYGIVGMRERAEEIGADLKISSVPGFGTKVVIQLPLNSLACAESNPEVAQEHHSR